MYCSVSLRDIDSGKPESIEWFIEDQTFSPSHDLAPPNPLPLSRQQVVSLSQSPVCRLSSLQMEEGEEKEPNHTAARKPGQFSHLYIIQYSILSVVAVYPLLNNVRNVHHFCHSCYKWARMRQKIIFCQRQICTFLARIALRRAECFALYLLIWKSCHVISF